MPGSRVRAEGVEFLELVGDKQQVRLGAGAWTLDVSLDFEDCGNNVSQGQFALAQVAGQLVDSRHLVGPVQASLVQGEQSCC